MMQQLQKQENGNKIIRLFNISIAFSLIDIPVVLAVEYNLTYDVNGNLIQGKDKYFEYNTLNQLFRVRENNQNGNILEEYFYDHEGNRVLKKVYESGQLTQEIYYIDKNYIQIVNSTGTFNEVYYYDDSGLIAENGTDSRLKAYHSDHLGSTNLVTNESGSVVEEDYYEPYGSELQDSNSRFTYTGKEKDATGLMYYGARNYNPEQAQFIQADKVLAEVYDPQQLNRYAYARNNPYLYKDKEGKEIVSVVVYTIIETTIDVISLAISSYFLAKNPNSVINQIAYTADVIDLAGGPISNPGPSGLEVKGAEYLYNKFSYKISVGLVLEALKEGGVDFLSKYGKSNTKNSDFKNTQGIEEKSQTQLYNTKSGTTNIDTKTKSGTIKQNIQEQNKKDSWWSLFSTPMKSLFYKSSGGNEKDEEKNKKNI